MMPTRGAVPELRLVPQSSSILRDRLPLTQGKSPRLRSTFPSFHACFAVMAFSFRAADRARLALPERPDTEIC